MSCYHVHCLQAQDNHAASCTKSYVYAHIISRINYILPFVAGHKIEIHKKIMDIWVMAAKFIYGKNTRKLSYPKLFERVVFKRTAINSAIACLNKADLALTRLAPAKLKKGLTKVKLNEKARKKF